MEGKIENVIECLKSPEFVRRSKVDICVYLYYRKMENTGFVQWLGMRMA